MNFRLLALGLFLGAVGLGVSAKQQENQTGKDQPAARGSVTPASAAQAKEHLTRGTALFEQDKLDEAVGEFLEALRLEPDNGDAHSSLSDALRRRGDFDGALLEAQKAVRLKPEDAAAHRTLGSALRMKGDLDAAITEYRKALNLNPGYAEAYAGMGNALFQKHDLEGAIIEYREAIRLKPDLAPAHVDLGNALESKGEKDGAVAEFREALRLRANDVNAHHFLGLALYERHDYPEAITEFQEAVKLNPKHQAAWNNLGRVYFALGQLDAAIDAYHKQIEVNPRDKYAYNNLGRALWGQQKYGEAITAFSKQIEVDPENPYAHANLGKLYLKLQYYSDAVPELEKASAIKPNDQEILGNLREAYLKLGKTDKATQPAKTAAAASSIPPQPPSQTAGAASQALTREIGTDRDLTVIRVGSDVTAARIVNRTTPVYPPLARQTRISGTVRLHALIDGDGSVAQLEVVSGHPLLVQSALDAVRQWRYQPTFLNGAPVQVDTVIDVIFSLDTDSTASSNTKPSSTPEPNPSELGKSKSPGEGVFHVGGNVSAPAPILAAPPVKDTDEGNIQEARSLTPEDIPALSQKAEAGDKNAQAILALAYSWGNPVKQDCAEAAKWTRRAAEQGSALAQDLLGKFYLLGQCVLKDDAEAMKWLQKSADQGFHEGQYDLGAMYFQGQGVPKDYHRAHQLFLKASEQWLVKAHHNLCVMYANGNGVPRDLVTAGMWGLLAASPNNGMEPGRGCMEQISPKMMPDQITEARRRAMGWMIARLYAQTRQITGTIISVASSCVSFVVSHEADGKKQETTLMTNYLEDPAAAIGAQGCNIFLPSGKRMVLLIGSKATIDYLVREQDNLAVSVASQ